MSVELRVEKAVAGGDGLARLDGRVVFVEGALPGELVRAELAGGKRDWLKARAVSRTGRVISRTSGSAGTPAASSASRPR